MSRAAVLKKLLPMAVSYIGSGGSLIFSSFAQLATFAILARSLGTDQFALYVTLTAVTNVAVQICGIGAQETLIRRIAQNPADYPRLMGHALLLTIGSAVLIIGAGLALLPIVLPTSTDPLINFGSLALLMISTVFILRLVSLAIATYIARSNFVVANALEAGFGLMRLLAALLGCLVFKVDTVAQWSVWFFSAHLVVAIAAVLLLRPLGAPRYEIVREEIRIGALFSTQFIFRAIRQNTDIVVLGMLTSPEMVSSYGVARRVLDSSYLSVEALNRLIYPGSAVALLNGFHHAFDRVRKVLAAALVISVAAAIAVFVLAPLMPLLFGDKYPSMIEFTRVLCWLVIPTAISSVVLESFGAAGRQDVRAVIYNGANIVAAGLVALATLVAGINGALASSYAVEIATALVAWMALMRFVDTDRGKAAAPMPAE